MQVTSTTNITNPAAASAAGSTPAATSSASQSASTLDYTTFLRLLIAELKNQDPTKPMDSAQYIGQLASFSNVEQAVKTNAKLDAMMSSMALTQAEGFIGRRVASEDGSIVGTVAGMRVISGGAVAILTDGRQLPLGAGVTVM